MSKQDRFQDKSRDDEAEDFEIEEKDERVNDDFIQDPKEPLFPFDKMPYQEKGENEIHEFEMGADQELDLGESDERMRRRNLGEERGAGHEP